MSGLAHDFSPGVLIRARGREWVVQPESSREVLRLRPFGGADEDIVTLIPLVVGALRRTIGERTKT